MEEWCKMPSDQLFQQDSWHAQSERTAAGGAGRPLGTQRPLDARLEFSDGQHMYVRDRDVLTQLVPIDLHRPAPHVPAQLTAARPMCSYDRSNNVTELARPPSLISESEAPGPGHVPGQLRATSARAGRVWHHRLLAKQGAVAAASGWLPGGTPRPPAVVRRCAAGRTGRGRCGLGRWDACSPS
eukprot:scaffold36304_cov121-Isochrysis_galbana.AAC.3